MEKSHGFLVRLGVASVALAVAGAAVSALPVRKKKEKPAAMPVVEALVHQVLTKPVIPVVKPTTPPPTSASGAVAKIFATPVVVGAGGTGMPNADGKARDLTVLGDVRVAGDLEAGALGDLQTKDGKPVLDNEGNFIYKTPGRKHIIGITSLDPHSQQFRIVFKDKTALSHGAFVDLDFVTTATGHLGNAAFTEADNLSAPAGKKATVGVRLHNVFCHPQMSAAQILAGLAGAATDQAKFIMNGYLDGANPTDQDSLSDLRLKAHVRVEEGSTNNVNFGFVPASKAYPVNVAVAVVGDDDTYAQAVDTGFYDEKWLTRKDRPVYEVGTLSYQIASDNVVSAETVSQVANGELLPADVFQLFTDEELVSLLAILKDYFGEDVAKMRDYLVANRHQLSRAFHASH